MASSARIDELRRKFEENPRRYFAPLANEYRKAGDIDQAVAICREYLPQQPGHMSGHIVYGQALYEARQFEESKTVFETALSLDPENLIALRHLGDIALIVGDSEGARGWYRRVLEADPRNEEIQSQLAALEQSSPSPTPVTTPIEPATDASSAATLVVELSSDLTPLSMPSVPASPALVRPAPDPPAPADPALETTTEVVLENLSTTPTAEVHLDLTRPAGSDGSSTSGTEVQSLDLELPVAGASTEEQALISGFSLEGLESFERPGEAPEADLPSQPLPYIETTSAPPDSAPVAGSTSFPELNFDGPAPQETTSDAASEIPTHESVPVSQAPAASSTVDLPMIDVSVPSAPTPAPEPLPVLPTTAASGSGAFVTETMAELYLSQGHRDEALRVYRALLEQRPGDAALRARVAELEPAPGPTIREVLKVLALRRPGHRAEAASHETNGKASQPPVSMSESPTASLASTGTLTDLFAGSPVSAHDENAANALALSFAGTTPHADAALDSLDTTGAPAHLATNELSLDAVFGAGKSAAAPSSFSFDQFFSRRATTPTGSGVQAPADATDDAADDIADFTQWLEGLKQK